MGPPCRASEGERASLGAARAVAADRAVFEAGAFAWGAATTVENRAPTARGAAAAAAAAGNITGEGGE